MAMALAQDELVGKFVGAVVSSTMGCSIMFAFPMSFALSPKEKRPLVAKGIAIGLTTIPVSCFVGGLCFGIDIVKLLLNMLPLIVFSGIFVVGLIFFEKITIKIVTWMGYIITAVLTLALAAAMVIKVLNWEVPDFGSFDEGMVVIGGIAIFLCGAFSLLFFIQKLFGKSFAKLGEKTGMNETSILGILTTMVNAVPMFGMTKDMNDRGVVVNYAFLIPAAFIIGDHLAFQSAVDSSASVPLILSKLSGGVLAVFLSTILTKTKKETK